MGWVYPDRKLAAALTNISEGEVGRQLTLASTTALNNNTVQRGRVLLAIVFQYFAGGNSAQVLYDLSHLQKLTLMGDNLESFHNTWTMVLSELSKPPEPELLRTLYFRHVQYFKPPAEDIAHCKRAKYEPGNPVYSFEWLWAASCRYLLMNERDTCSKPSTEASPAHLKVPQAPMPPPKVAEGEA